MAGALGITVQQYSFLERFDRFKNLPLNLAARIGALFNITLEDILKYEEADLNAKC